ncbi:GNAT family N-acetyltransferase [Wenzhouxiangella sp. EGI_FJ10305]|uniref:GNAT family N-acetyltransferase n=1 Tax=Wenzhouxiangella sp. EGI_FJ10305 TaxID=3243768 RepID=UPI0035DF7B1E
MPRSLIQPSLEYESSYRAYIQELRDEERYPFPLDFEDADFSSLIDRLADLRAGRNLPPSIVASSTFWLVGDGEILGVSNLRHSLNHELRRRGGHIGLGIRPSQRGRGLGTKLMSLTIQEAWKLGIREVHIHCYKANTTSASLIKANGGTLESEVDDLDTGNVIQRFVVVTPNKSLNSDAGKAGAG